MKRNRNINLDKDCKVTSDCNILCGSNGENWYYVSSPDELPEDLRFEYINCQHRKRNEAQISDSLFDFEEAEQDRVKAKRNPKYIMNKIKDKFEDLRTSQDVEPLVFPQDLTLEEKRDKLAFEEPVVLTETRTRLKKCQDNTNLLTYLESRFEVNIQRLKSAIQHIMHIQDVKFVKILGSGQDGVAFTICNPTLSSQLLVVKYQYDEEYKTRTFEHEFKMQMKFFQAGIAPEPKFLHISPNIIIMAKLDGTVNELLESRCSQELLDGILKGIVDILSVMCVHKLTHGDLHWVNIGYVYTFEELDDYPLQRTMTFQLIDFANSQNEGCDPEMELAQLIRRSFPQISSTLNLENLNYLRENLLLLYSQNYDIDLEDANNVSYWTKKLGANLFQRN
jgi:hypothetical protein